MHVQGDLGGKVSILGSTSIGPCEKKGYYEHAYKSEWLQSWSCLNLQTQLH
jgi:hypothetical protein